MKKKVWIGLLALAVVIVAVALLSSLLGGGKTLPEGAAALYKDTPISEETVAYLEKYGLAGYFTHIIGPGSEGFAVKPAPDAVLFLTERYGMDPAETVMVGDRECDLGSGRNAGIRTAHLVCPVAPETLDCNWRFESFAQMLKELTE